jgi:disintegrin and metalloproteinase domain-containing protein 17
VKSLCGNYKLDDGEQCDEGPVGQSCCTKSCQFKDGIVCSDWNEPCCENCRIANAGRPCRDPIVEPCSKLPYCNGNSSACPTPAAKQDGVACEKQFRGVCFNQTCTSVCEYNNKTSCTCDSVELSCRICCRDTPSENDTCKVYRALNDTMDYGNLSDSSPCSMGLCSNGVCKKVTDTSVKRSWRFIEIISFSHFVIFMKNNIVGTVIVLSLLLWIPASCTVSYIVSSLLLMMFLLCFSHF